MQSFGDNYLISFSTEDEQVINPLGTSPSSIVLSTSSIVILHWHEDKTDRSLAIHFCVKVERKSEVEIYLSLESSNFFIQSRKDICTIRIFGYNSKLSFLIILIKNSLYHYGKTIDAHF